MNTTSNGWTTVELVLTSDGSVAFRRKPERLIRSVLGGLAVALLEDLYGQFGNDLDIDLDSPRNYAQASYSIDDGANVTLHIVVRPERADEVGDFARRRWNGHLDDVRSDLERGVAR